MATQREGEARGIIMAGAPVANAAVYHRVRFAVLDTVVYLEVPAAGGVQRVLILRDIEVERARRQARVDVVYCPSDLVPKKQLSGDREVANAQAAAECLRRHGVRRVVGDRTLPLVYVEMLSRAGLAVDCDLELGVAERRTKDADEIAHLREAQRVTEEVMERACRVIARASAGRDGVLRSEGQALTSERVRVMIDHWLVEYGYANLPAIVAGGPVGADCHALGTGELRTGEPVIVDIFPRNRTSLYHGDCTRTVVHGDVPDEVERMHRAVCEAKRAAMQAVRAGVTGQEVHEAACQAILAAGFAVGPGPEDDPSFCSMTHGTGHGVGLEVHEAPLLDRKGPPLVVGDVVTIEPGLYRKELGGVRVEDMVAVTAEGAMNLNRLPEALDWR